MSNSTDDIAPQTAENEKCTTDAPTKKVKVNDCKLVSITLPNAGPLGLGLLEKDGGKSVIIDEVILQSQAEKYGVLAGDIPIYNNSISSIVGGGIGYISYETFLQRARDERPFVFSVLRHNTDKSGSISMNQSSISEGSRELKDGACEPSTKKDIDMVHEGSINANTDGQNNTAIISGSIAVKDMTGQLAAAAATTQRFTNFTSKVSDTPLAARTSSTIINNIAITPGSSMKIRGNITPPKRFVARPSTFGLKKVDDDKELEKNEYPDNLSNKQGTAILYGEQKTPNQGPLPSDKPLIHTYNNQKTTTHINDENRKSTANSFPKKLFDLLQKEDASIVSWLPEGDAFTVRDNDRFVSDILPRYFRGTKVSQIECL